MASNYEKIGYESQEEMDGLMSDLGSLLDVVDTSKMDINLIDDIRTLTPTKERVTGWISTIKELVG